MSLSLDARCLALLARTGELSTLKIWQAVRPDPESEKVIQLFAGEQPTLFDVHTTLRQLEKEGALTSRTEDRSDRPAPRRFYRRV